MATRAKKLILTVLLLVGLELITSANAFGSGAHEMGNKSILLGVKEKKDQCRMFYSECTFQVLISKLIPVADLFIYSSNDEIYNFESIEQCEGNCSLDPFESYNLSWPTKTHVNYNIKIKPALIGASDLVFFRNSTNKEVARWSIVIFQPKRVVDKIFDIWIWVFGTLISLLMGVLIDRESLLKIIRMPKAVIIGFCCQYLFMPLVIKI